MQNQPHDQLQVVAAELAAERKRASQLYDQLQAVAAELAAGRKRLASFAPVLSQLGRWGEAAELTWFDASEGTDVLAIIAQAVEQKALPGSEVISKLTELGKGSESLALLTAHHLARAGLFASALHVLHALMAVNRKCVGSLLLIAQIEMQYGKRDAAVDALAQALRIEPTNPTAWSSLSNMVGGTADRPNDPTSLAQAVATLLGSWQRRMSATSEQPAGVVARTAMSVLPENSRVIIVDAGARDAHRDPRWRLLPPRRVVFYGFEPDPPECERLNRDLQMLGVEGKYFPIGLGEREGRFPFHVNRAPGGSSFLRQNRRVTDRWKFENPTTISYAREMFFEERTVEEPVIDVRSWAMDASVPAIDFIKLNVQGAEVAILKGMGPMLDHVRGALVEVAFVESYIDRPMFSDVDQFLRNAGFTFFDLLAHHYVGRAASPYTSRHAADAANHLGQLRSSWGQLIEGHALYLRDPISGQVTTQVDSYETTLRLIAIADVFGQTEFALELLSWALDRARDRHDETWAQTLADARSRAVASLDA